MFGSVAPSAKNCVMYAMPHWYQLYPSVTSSLMAALACLSDSTTCSFCSSVPGAALALAMVRQSIDMHCDAFLFGAQT